MKPHSVWLSALLLVLLMAAPIVPAAAAIVELGNSYQPGAVLVNGSANSLLVTDFHAAIAGIVRLSLTDLGFGNVLQSLSAYVSSNNVSLYSLKTAGSLSFAVTAGQVFSTSVLAIAVAPMNYGAYNLGMTFTPSSAVPIFSSGWLLVSGLLALGIFRRRLASVTEIVSQ